MVEKIPAPGCATRMLNRLSTGDPAASQELLGIVYAELKRLAEHHMAQQPANHTLQPTALVHEAWLRLVDQTDAHYENRKRFFAMASRVMRSLLVDHARARRARPQDGELRVTLAEGLVAGAPGVDLELMALDEALEELGRTDEELLRVVELRYFGGLTAQEAADALDMPLRSFERSFQVARIWLFKRLSA